MMKIITEKVIDSKFRVQMTQEKIQEHIVTEKEALVRRIIIALLVLVPLLITEGFLFSKLLAIRSEVIDDRELTGETPFEASTESLSSHPTSGSTTNSQSFSETSTESTSIGTARSTTSNTPETSGTVSTLPASKPRQLELSSSRRTFLQTTPFEASTESLSLSLPEASHESPSTVHPTSSSTTARSTTTVRASVNSETDVTTNGTGIEVGSSTSNNPETSGMWSNWSSGVNRTIEEYAPMDAHPIKYPTMAKCKKTITRRTRICLTGKGSCTGSPFMEDENDEICTCNQCCERNFCGVSKEGFKPCFCSRGFCNESYCGGECPYRCCDQSDCSRPYLP